MVERGLSIAVTFTFRVFIRPFLPKATYNKSICQKKRKNNIYRYRCSKDVRRTKYQALTISRLTHSPYTTKIARIRCYTMLLSTIFKCMDIKHTISVYIK